MTAQDLRVGNETRVHPRSGHLERSQGEISEALTGAGGGDVVVVQCRVRSRISSSCRKEGGGVALAGALPREPNGIRASSDVPLLNSEEGAKMDLLEQAEPW